MQYLPSSGAPHPRYPTRDHVKPRSRFPLECADLVVWACFQCNSQKNDMTLDEWHELLRSTGDPRSDRISALLSAEGET